MQNLPENVQIEPNVVPIAERTSGKFRHFCFTINNWVEADRPLLDGLAAKYICYQPEVGESGTRHLQVRWHRVLFE